MSDTRPKRIAQTPIESKHIGSILRISELGAEWVAGKITIDQLEGSLGTLDKLTVKDTESYFYNGSGFGAEFQLIKINEIKQTNMGRKFHLGLNEWKSISIPRETFEQRLGLVRSVPGELIDGVRKETQLYMRRPIFDNQDPDEIGLYLRLPMPNDSLFDVRASFEYRAIPGQPVESNFDTTTNFRSLSIERWYLTPKALEEREHAKRVKYGAMDLRTGMICPETGWWQAWTDAGPVRDPFVWWEGYKFDLAYLPPPTGGVNGRFTWVKRYFPSPDLYADTH
jgi:hypothetical protein